MAHTSLNNLPSALAPSHKQQLLQLAGDSIKKGLSTYYFVERHVVFAALSALVLVAVSLLTPTGVRRLALVLTLALGLLWAGKLRVEERHLVAVYADYPAYQARVRHRLVPFLY